MSIFLQAINIYVHFPSIYVQTEEKESNGHPMDTLQWHTPHFTDIYSHITATHSIVFSFMSRLIFLLYLASFSALPNAI